MSRIEHTINLIRYYEDTDPNTGVLEKVYIFSGDGVGDFEETETEATPATVLNYIEFCQEQIKFAEAYLETLRSRN